MPVLAEAQPHPLRVSQLNADPKKYHEQEVVLRAYFVTDVSHFSIFVESRIVDAEDQKMHRTYLRRKDEPGFGVAYWKKVESGGKYCMRVLNPTRLYEKFGSVEAVKERTVSVRGIFIADAGKNILGNGCPGHEAGFLITEVLRKED